MTEESTITEGTAADDAKLVAELNDLLQLDHDAVHAYALAIAELSDPARKARLTEFRGDHERHIAELTQLIHSRGGVAMQLPHLTGVFKLAMQGLGAFPGDRAVLLAFRANERQVRDKYRRMAQATHPADLMSVLARAADDEGRHYAWVLDELDELGFDADSPAGRLAAGVERAHQRTADGVEAAERALMQGAERGRRAIARRADRNPIGTALIAVALGMVAARLVTRR